MIVVYTPPFGAEPEHYDASSLKVSEAAIVQRTIDMKWADIKEGLERDDLDAMRGIVWVIKKRSQPTLRFGDFDPGVDDMVTRMDKREVAAYVDRAFAATDTDPDLSREQVADILLKQLPDIAADPDHARKLITQKAAAPKADAPEEDSGRQEETETDSSPSPTSSTPEASTSDSSPTSSTSPLLSLMT